MVSPEHMREREREGERGRERGRDHTRVTTSIGVGREIVVGGSPGPVVGRVVRGIGSHAVRHGEELHQGQRTKKDKRKDKRR